MMKMELLALAVLSITITLYPLNALVLPVVRLSDDSDCFRSYSENLEVAGNNYTNNYMKCMDNTHNRVLLGTRNEIEKQMERFEIQTEANAVCERLKSCEQMKDQIDFFECHSDMGLINTHSMMIIHLNSTKILVELQEEKEEAEKALIQCKLDAECEYKEQTGVAYVELLRCLKEEENSA